MNCTKAIIPVAGYGTRRLPVSKSVEKCMLPVLNRPVIDYIVRDCMEAGIKEFIFVVNDSARQLQHFYDRFEKLEEYLKRNKKEQMLPLITPPEDCTFRYVVQADDSLYGTTVPVWLCRDYVSLGEQVMVIMGDQFFFNPDGTSETKRFLEEAEKAGTKSAMLAVEVPHEEVYKYGIVATKKPNGVEFYDYIVEKPKVEDAPTNLNNASFYLLDQPVFDYLDKHIQKGSDGEYYIIDPINWYVADGNDMAVIRNKGEYLDCGTVDAWLSANNRVYEATQA